MNGEQDLLRTSWDFTATDYHLTWQVTLYVITALCYGAAVLLAVKARTPFRKWLSASFLFTYLENIVTFALAMLGDDRYAWLLGNPDTTLYLSIVVASMATTITGFCVFTNDHKRPRSLDAVLPLRVDGNVLRAVLTVCSTGGALVSIVMSANGYAGYFTTVAYLYSPPAWLDVARALIGLGSDMLFAILVAANVSRNRLTWCDWTLVALWSLAGMVSGFKSMVVVPWFYVLFAAWLSNRLLPRQILLFLTALMTAYAVVEPLRAVRWAVPEDNALEGVAVLASAESLALPNAADVLASFVSRIDYTATGVAALEVDRQGALDGYRSKLSEAYRHLPGLAFVPRVLWPNKPLADYGRELSIVLTGIETNSITPSGVVASYLWYGYVGVVVNAIVLTYLVVYSGRLLMEALQAPLAYCPLLLLAIVVWTPESIVVSRYIFILRALVAFALFYLIAGRVGMLQGSQRPLLLQRQRSLRRRAGSSAAAGRPLEDVTARRNASNTST